METKNLNIDIKTYIEILPPIKYLNKNNKTILKFEDDNILEIFFQKNNLNCFKIKFFHEYNILSPNLDEFKNTYNINYSDIPLKKEHIKDFRKIIITLNKFFLIFEIDFNNIYSIFNNSKMNILDISFSQLYGLNIKINLYKQIEEYYIDTINEKTLPLWTFAPGIIIDYEKKSHQLNFSKLKECLKSDYLNIILKNWLVEEYILYHKIEKINKLKRFLGKLSLNNINYVLHFDNKISMKNYNDFHILKLRKGTPVEKSGKISLDYFSKEGQQELIKIYQNIYEIGCKGIFIDPTYYQFNDKDLLNKTICKTEKAFIPYSKYVQFGLKILNKIIGTFKDKLFLSNVLSKDIKNTIYMENFDNNITIKKIEEFYRQGFLNFGIIIKKQNFNLLSKTPNLSTSSFLIFNIIIFDIDIINDIISKENLIHNKFINIIKTRMKLRVLYDNLIKDFTREGILPVSGFYLNNELLGYYLGRYIFCSFLKERLLDSIFYLPKGNWYSIKNNILVKGEGYYNNKEKNDQFHLFQIENTILEIIENSVYNDYMNPNKIKFSIFPKIYCNQKNNSIIIEELKQEITERIIINEKEKTLNHTFLITQNKDTLNIKYENKNNLNRKIFFHIITYNIKINKIKCNNKKVIYRKKDNKPYVEFELMNGKNKFNIDIYLNNN